MTWLPLETLPGWPKADPVSDSWMILLLFVLPLAAGALIALLAFAPTLARRFRTESGTGTDVARRDDLQGPDAREIREDARVRQAAIQHGEDETPSSSAHH